MKLFDPENHSHSAAHKAVYIASEMAYTIVDFLAAVMFVVGSVLFFDEATTYAGTWLFLIGSILFGLRPAIRLYRELRYLSLPKVQKSDEN